MHAWALALSGIETRFNGFDFSAFCADNRVGGNGLLLSANFDDSPRTPRFSRRLHKRPYCLPVRPLRANKGHATKVTLCSLYLGGWVPQKDDSPSRRPPSRSRFAPLLPTLQKDDSPSCRPLSRGEGE